MKNKIYFFLILITLVSCNDNSSKAVLTKYIKASNNEDYKTTYSLLCAADKNAVTFEEYAHSDSKIYTYLNKKTKFNIVDESISETKQSITYTVDFNSVDLLELYKKLPILTRPNLSEKEINKIMKENKNQIELCRKTNKSTFLLVLENNKWVVSANLGNIKYIKKLRQEVLTYEKLGKYEQALRTLDLLYEQGGINEELSKAYVRIDQKDQYIKNQLHIQKVFMATGAKIVVTNGGTFGLRALDIQIEYVRDGQLVTSNQSMQLTDREFLGHDEKYTFVVDFSDSIMKISKLDAKILNIEF